MIHMKGRKQCLSYHGFYMNKSHELILPGYRLPLIL